MTDPFLGEIEKLRKRRKKRQFIDNRLERAFLPSVEERRERRTAKRTDLLNRGLKVNGVAR